MHPTNTNEYHQKKNDFHRPSRNYRRTLCSADNAFRRIRLGGNKPRSVPPVRNPCHTSLFHPCGDTRVVHRLFDSQPHQVRPPIRAIWCVCHPCGGAVDVCVYHRSPDQTYRQVACPMAGGDF